MKTTKAFGFIAIVLLCFVIVGCGSSKDSSRKTNNVSNREPAFEDYLPKPQQRANRFDVWLWKCENCQKYRITYGYDGNFSNPDDRGCRSSRAVANIHLFYLTRQRVFWRDSYNQSWALTQDVRY